LTAYAIIEVERKREREVEMAHCKCVLCDTYKLSPYKATKRGYYRRAAKDSHKQRQAQTDKTGFAAIRAVQREYNRRNIYESSG